MTERCLTRRGLRIRTRKLRPVVGLTLFGFALTLLSVAAAPTAASAFGGAFGHMGGLGGGGMGMGPRMGPSWHSRMVTPRRGGSTYVRRPPGGNVSNGDGNRWPPRHPVIGHPIIVPVPGGIPPPPSPMFRRHHLRAARPA